jgi:hypothetical protein
VEVRDLKTYRDQSNFLTSEFLKLVTFFNRFLFRIFKDIQRGESTDVHHLAVLLRRQPSDKLHGNVSRSECKTKWVHTDR